MDKQNELVQITLYDEKEQELIYFVKHIFGLEGTDQKYCAVMQEDEENTIFLRCSLVEKGENTELIISDIPDIDEYNHVVDAFQEYQVKTIVENNRETLLDYEDYITVSDVDGNKVDFIIHTIFEDTSNHRSYAAVQRIEKTGTIVEEISLYRFEECDNVAVLEMIPSDMEYERARNVFIGLISERE